MKAFRNKLSKLNQKPAGFTLVEIMIVVLIIGILLAIAIPNFVKARETARAQSCVANLKQIDSATQQYAMVNRMGATASLTGVTVAVLSGANSYIRVTPTCPESGVYALGANPSLEPYCNISDNTAHGSGGGAGTVTDAADFGSGGKWYHGLSN